MTAVTAKRDDDMKAGYGLVFLSISPSDVQTSISTLHTLQLLLLFRVLFKLPQTVF